MTGRPAGAVLVALVLIAAALSWRVVGPTNGTDCKRTATYSIGGNVTCDFVPVSGGAEDVRPNYLAGVVGSLPLDRVPAPQAREAIEQLRKAGNLSGHDADALLARLDKGEDVGTVLRDVMKQWNRQVGQLCVTISTDKICPAP
jgi:hypothetical protein